MGTAPGKRVESKLTARRRAAGPNKSTLLSATTRGLPAAPRSASTFSTVSACSSAPGELTSRTCTIRSASVTSSRVARKAATRSVGSFWMKPTVSVRRSSRPVGSSTRRVVGSRVANRRCSARTRAPVSAFSSVDLQAYFVCARVLREDLQDHLGPIEDSRLQLTLEVALLSRAEVLVADHEVEATLQLELAQLVDLAHADEMRGIHLAAPLDIGADDLRAGGAREVRQLRHLVANELGRAPRQQHPDQVGPLAWRLGRDHLDFRAGAASIGSWLLQAASQVP